MWKFAFRNLLSRPTRSLLSLLGLTVAIAGMVGLFSVATGIEATVNETFSRVPGLLVMQAGAPIPLFSRLPLKWGNEIAQLDGVGAVTPEVLLRANIIDGQNVITPPRFLLGTDIPSRLKLKAGVYSEAVKQGRFLTLDDRGSHRVVVSRSIAEQFHKQLGNTLRINGADFTIVGLYHTGSILLDVVILVDVGTLRQLGWADADSACSFYVEANGRVPHDELVKRIEDRFRGRSLATASPLSWLSILSPSGTSSSPNSQGGSTLGKLLGWLSRPAPPNQPENGNSGLTSERGSEPADNSTSPTRQRETEAPQNSDPSLARRASEEGGQSTKPDNDILPIEVRSSSDWAERFNEFSQDLDLFLALMTGIGMTVAVLSIINTMLMSVSERVIEFGILKANGWTPVDVLKLVTFESATLGMGGGVFGCLTGFVATLVVNATWPDRIHLFASPGLLLFSWVFSTAVGMLGGLYPAIWAMRLSPMDAIRRG